MEYWHGACQAPIRLTDSDRGRCSLQEADLTGSASYIDKAETYPDIQINDWQLAPVAKVVALGSRASTAAASVAVAVARSMAATSTTASVMPPALKNT